MPNGIRNLQLLTNLFFNSVCCLIGRALTKKWHDISNDPLGRRISFGRNKIALSKMVYAISFKNNSNYRRSDQFCSDIMLHFDQYVIRFLVYQ